jgi:hypothetical protein
MATKEQWLEAMSKEERKRRRDRFAGLALQGMLAAGDQRRVFDVTAEAVRLADAMLAELDKETK